MKRVYIWGTGKYYRWIKNYLLNADIMGFISQCGEADFEGKKVYRTITNDMMQDVDYLLIANIYTDEIVKNMIFAGFSVWDKVVVCEPSPLTNMLGLRDNEPEIIEKSFFSNFSSKYGSKNISQISMPLPNYRLAQMVAPDTDPVRKYVLSMIANEIDVNNVEGDVAEFGVFTGDFAMEINMVFRDRRLLLFDTFSGFPEKDIEAAKAFSPQIDSFCEACKATTIELVMSKMEYPEQVELYKGIFPQSTVNVGKFRKFAFVSIDVDFKENTLSGLRYFYPRLSSGGYIMLHDYNNKNENGDFGAMVKNAIKEFENQIGYKVAKVPLCDRGGTCVIAKL
ncbi:MAG: hypothetical protein J6O04_08730 [Selenomonadaceae bacterium]|nr:hypothetical protein [Selenomonadaceae bacterium]